MAIILALISFLGIIMNKLLLSAIRSDHKLYSMTSNFVCLADLGNSLNGLIMMILVLSQGYIPSLGCQITVLLHVIVLVLGSSHVGEVHKPGAPEKDAAKDRSSIHKNVASREFPLFRFSNHLSQRELWPHRNEEEWHLVLCWGWGRSFRLRLLRVHLHVLLHLHNLLHGICYVKIYNAIKKVFRNAQGGVSEEERPMRSTVSEQRLLVQFIIITCFFLFCWGTLIADVVLE